MSNTYRDNAMARYKRSDFHDENWDTICREAFGHNLYNSCPKDWNKMFHTRPHRANEKRKLHTVDLDNMGEHISFPHYKRPHHYYW